MAMSEVAIEDNHRCQRDKTGSREKPSWLPPPPRCWLNPIRIGVIEIVRVGIYRFQRRNPLGLTGCSGAVASARYAFLAVSRNWQIRIFFKELTNRR